MSAEEWHLADYAEPVALGVQLDDEVVGVEIDVLKKSGGVCPREVHNRYFIAPFLGLLLGLSLRDRPCRWVVGMFCAYVAETVLRGALYLGGPVAELLDHASVYPRSDEELVACLRTTATASDRLFVVPENGGESVARFYVLSDAVPANLTVRHNENLGWGTEFMFGDDELIARAVSNATCLVVHRPMDFGRWVRLAEETGLKKVESMSEWDVFRR